MCPGGDGILHGFAGKAVTKRGCFGSPVRRSELPPLMSQLVSPTTSSKSRSNIMAKASAPKATEIEILSVNKGKIVFLVVGTMPLILNRVSEKAKHELLLPKGRKTAADKAMNLKHDPIAEYRSSPYINSDPTSPTLLQFMASAFKGAIRDAALDIAGVSKAQIGRLVWVEGERVDIYGVPKLFMSVTRSADQARTPDIRTRAIVPEWCCEIRVSYVTPILKEKSIVNLMASAGVMQGLGDWRTGKGAGTYGSFELVEEGNEKFERIKREGGRAAQQAALDDPDPYDLETQDLLEWFMTESKNRGLKVVGAAG